MIPTKKKTYIWYILSGILVLPLIVWLFTPTPIPVETAKVAYGYYAQFIEEDAKTRAKKIYTLTAPVSGTLLRINHLEGDFIKKDEIVAVIKPVTASLLDIRTKHEQEEDLGAAEAELKQVKEEIERTRVALENARTDLKRNQDLVKNKFVSKRELEQSELMEQFRQKEHEAAKYKLHAVEHKIEKIKKSLENMPYSPGASNSQVDIPSPVEGRIFRIYKKSESTIQVGTTILDIAEPSELEIVADVLSTEAPQIPANAKVIIERWGGPKPLNGKVRFIEPSGFTKLSALGIEEQRVNVIIDIISPLSEWKNLGDAFQVDVKIITFESNHSLTIPISAVFRDENNWAVFVVDKGKAVKRVVNIASRNPEQASIGHGLQQGEEVILFPSNEIREGLRVKKKK